MFSEAKIKFLKWMEKKPSGKTAASAIPQTLVERDAIVEETKNTRTFLENLREEYERILDQLLQQLPALSESGDDKNSIIKQKVDCLKKHLIVIKRGLEDSQIFLTLLTIVDNIENELKLSELQTTEFKKKIKSLKNENNSLREDLSLTQLRLLETEQKAVTLEVERDHLAYMNSLFCEQPKDTPNEEDSIDLSFIDENTEAESEGSFPNLPCLIEVNESLNSKLKIFYDLVMAYIEKGSYEIAAPLCKTTLQDWQEKYGPEHPDVVTMMDIITIVYRAMRRFKEATNMQLDVLEIKRRTLAKDDISIASTLNNVSALYGKTGQKEEAEKFCRKAVEFRKEVLGKTHPDVGKQLCNLAAICSHTKQFSEAIDCYKEALEIFASTIGLDSTYASKANNHLASLYIEVGRYKEAEKLYREILKPEEGDLQTS